MKGDRPQPKEALFVAEYPKDFNGSAAAIRAGYSPKGARVAAAKLLARPRVQAALAKVTEARLQRADLTAVRVLEELRRLAFSDVRDLFDTDGNLRPIHELTAEQSAAIASIEVVKRNLTAGDGHLDTVVKIKAWDKTRTLELLAKHFSLLTEKVTHDGELIIKWES